MMSLKFSLPHDAKSVSVVLTPALHRGPHGKRLALIRASTNLQDEKRIKRSKVEAAFGANVFAKLIGLDINIYHRMALGFIASSKVDVIDPIVVVGGKPTSHQLPERGVVRLRDMGQWIL
jgi:hypothetical protein